MKKTFTHDIKLENPYEEPKLNKALHELYAHCDTLEARIDYLENIIRNELA